MVLFKGGVRALCAPTAPRHLLPFIPFSFSVPTSTVLVLAIIIIILTHEVLGRLGHEDDDEDGRAWPMEETVPVVVEPLATTSESVARV
jgi:hypothetical protein